MTAAAITGRLEFSWSLLLLQSLLPTIVVVPELVMTLSIMCTSVRLCYCVILAHACCYVCPDPRLTVDFMLITQ